MSIHRVAFTDNTIGRRHAVDPIEIEISGTFQRRLDDAAEAIYRHALKNLGSREVDVYVGSSGGEIMVGGFRRVSEFTITPAIEVVA